MDRRVVVEAPAKVNLHLQVLGKRSDGFHDILSVFQAISLCDKLEIRTVSSRGVRLTGDFDCVESENTIVRASRAFLAAACLEDGLEIRAEKRIPAGAGLARRVQRRGGDPEGLEPCVRGQALTGPFIGHRGFRRLRRAVFWAEPAPSFPAAGRSWRRRRPGQTIVW